MTAYSYQTKIKVGVEDTVTIRRRNWPSYVPSRKTESAYLCCDSLMPRGSAHLSRYAAHIFALVGVLMGWCWFSLSFLGDIRHSLSGFFIVFALAFMMYLVSLWVVKRVTTARTPENGQVKLSVLIILLGAIASRLLLLGAQPELSSDIHRYLWDGRVQLAGIDPYAHPPDSQALEFLRDDSFSEINFPHLRTVYPPVAQLAFRLGAWINPTITVQKFVFLLAELLTIMSLLLILSLRNLSPLWVVAYAWHPLVILEFAGSGHNDAIGIAFLWLGLAAWQARHKFVGILAWSAAFLSKFLPVVLVPWLWFRRGNRRWLAAFLVLAGLPFLIHLTAVTALVESLSAVAGRGESNSSLYLLFMTIIGSAAVARWVSIGILLSFLIFWGRREANPAKYLFGAFLVMALLSPAVHPWYLAWLVPFFCLWRVPAVVAWSATIVLAYTVWPGYLSDGFWKIPLWARWLEYAPIFVLGFWELRKCMLRSSFLPAMKQKA